MRSTFPVLTLGILAAALAARPVAAATASASISVTATVQASCLVSATATAFGTYAGAAANAASAVSVACSNSTPYNVSLSTAVAPGAAVANREMTGSGVALPGFALRSNFRRMVNWGQPLPCRYGRRVCEQLRPGTRHPSPDFGMAVRHCRRRRRYDYCSRDLLNDRA